MLDDFLGENVGIGTIGGLLEAFISEPEDVEAGFVAGEDVGIGVFAPAAFGIFFGVPGFFGNGGNRYGLRWRRSTRSWASA